MIVNLCVNSVYKRHIDCFNIRGLAVGSRARAHPRSASGSWRDVHVPLSL